AMAPSVSLDELLEADADEARYTPIDDFDLTQFSRDGFLLVPGALDGHTLARVEAAADQVYAEESNAGRLRADGSLHLMGMLHREPALLDLVDHPATFRYVWGLMGW